MIKAIETAYKGYRFRSRLEARWAVFFDALGLEWQYEPEGFEFEGGVRYLPDFYLPKFDSGVYVEVKPEGGDDTKSRLLAKATGRPVMLAFGDPDTRSFACWNFGPSWGSNELASVAFLDKYLVGRNAHEHRLYWAPESDRYDEEDFVRSAVHAARSARFEHGESGAWRR